MNSRASKKNKENKPLTFPSKNPNLESRSGFLTVGSSANKTAKSTATTQTSSPSSSSSSSSSSSTNHDTSASLFKWATSNISVEFSKPIHITIEENQTASISEVEIKYVQALARRIKLLIIELGNSKKLELCSSKEALEVFVQHQLGQGCDYYKYLPTEDMKRCLGKKEVDRLHFVSSNLRDIFPVKNWADLQSQANVKYQYLLKKTRLQMTCHAFFDSIEVADIQKMSHEICGHDPRTIMSSIFSRWDTDEKRYESALAVFAYSITSANNRKGFAGSRHSLIANAETFVSNVLKMKQQLLDAKRKKLMLQYRANNAEDWFNVVQECNVVEEGVFLIVRDFVATGEISSQPNNNKVPENSQMPKTPENVVSTTKAKLRSQSSDAVNDTAQKGTNGTQGASNAVFKVTSSPRGSSLVPIVEKPKPMSDKKKNAEYERLRDETDKIRKQIDNERAAVAEEFVKSRSDLEQWKHKYQERQQLLRKLERAEADNSAELFRYRTQFAVMAGNVPTLEIGDLKSTQMSLYQRLSNLLKETQYDIAESLCQLAESAIFLSYKSTLNRTGLVFHLVGIPNINEFDEHHKRYLEVVKAYLKTNHGMIVEVAYLAVLKLYLDWKRQKPAEVVKLSRAGSGRPEQPPRRAGSSDNSMTLISPRVLDTIGKLMKQKAAKIPVSVFEAASFGFKKDFANLLNLLDKVLDISLRHPIKSIDEYGAEGTILDTLRKMLQFGTESALVTTRVKLVSENHDDALFLRSDKITTLRALVPAVCLESDNSVRIPAVVLRPKVVRSNSGINWF